MLENQYRTTLSSKTLQIISQLPLEGSEKVYQLSKTFDVVSLLLDTAATEHEIWMTIALVNNLERIDALASCELETLKVTRELLLNPSLFEKVKNETALYLVATIITVDAKKLAGSFDGNSVISSGSFVDSFERLCLYKSLVKKTRLYSRFHKYLKICLSLSPIEPCEFLEERKVFVMSGAQSNTEHMKRIVYMAEVAGIPVARKDEDIYLSDLVCHEELLERFILLIQAHFPTVAIRRSNRSYSELEWKVKRLTIFDKSSIFRRIGFRNHLTSIHLTDALFEQFYTLLPEHEKEANNK